MDTASVPVDLDNPGQVFACLGLIEAADALAGNAQGGFTWNAEYDLQARFMIEAATDINPIETVLDFLSDATAIALAPAGWTPSSTKNVGASESIPDAPCPMRDLGDMALPVVLRGSETCDITLGHWADGSSRDDFKLYAGNRSALKITQSMLAGIRQLWNDRRADMVSDPFGTTCPMRGSFNFDARCAWEAIDLGYSPNDHSQKVLGSPTVELLAAWGLEHARPTRVQRRVYRYGTWSGLLPPILARPALGGVFDNANGRSFRLRLGLSGKNKVVGYAEEETSQ